MDLAVRVAEIRGHCPAYEVGDEFQLLGGWRIASETPLCMHSLTALMPFYNALRFAEPADLGLACDHDTKLACVQCPDPCAHTGGGTAVFNINRVGSPSQPADRGDTTSLAETVEAAVANLLDVQTDPATEGCLHEVAMEEVVADKGYHSNATMTELGGMAIRSYVSEPDRGKRTWKGRAGARQAVHANRRRIRGVRGKRLMCRRGEVIERTFAHCYETGGMRRTHLRWHGNILKRLLVHVAGFNLGLVMRALRGIGKPRRAQDGRARSALGLGAGVLDLAAGLVAVLGSLRRLRACLRALRPAPARLTRLPAAA